MASADCSEFEALLDHMLGELRIALARKHHSDMLKSGILIRGTERANQFAEFETPARPLPEVRAETMHSMYPPEKMDTVSRGASAVSLRAGSESTGMRDVSGNSFSFQLSGKAKKKSSLQSRARPESLTMCEGLQITQTGSDQGSLRALQPSRPDDGLRVAWDVVMCVVVFLLIVVETTSLAIPEIEEGVFANWWSWFLLVMFSVDILVSFNTALVWTVGRKTVVVYDRWHIAKAYFKGWFTIDALSTFPFDLVLGSAVSTSGARMLKLGKILRTARLVKGFLKIAKVMERWGDIQDKIHEKFLDIVGCQGQEIDKSQKYVSRAWGLFCFLLIETHLVSCFLLIVSRNVQSMSWRAGDVDIHDLDPYARYVAAFRGVIYILATGNGNFGVSDILLSVLSVWFYIQLNVVISLFVGIKSDAGLNDEDFSTKCSRLRRYLRKHKVVKRVRDEVDSHLSKVGKYVGMNLDILLEELPSSIRQSVTAGLYYPFYESMAFFMQDGPESFEYKICAAVETLFYRPLDVIVSEGSALHGLHYLSEGYAAITKVLSGGAAEETEWCPGKYLFLESLFASKPLSASTGHVEAIESCEVWFLARTVFDKLLQETDPSFRSRVDLVRSKVHFKEEFHVWVMEILGGKNKVEWVGLEYLVDGEKFTSTVSQPTSLIGTGSQPTSLIGTGSQPTSLIGLGMVSQIMLPPGKRFHYFLSHRKYHSKLGNRSELVAQSLHDALDAKGFTGFFDADNLVEISRPAVEQAVLDSCALIIVLNDETAGSEWCRLEWECAATNGIPMKCVVDAQHCSKADLLWSARELNIALLQYQWSEYLDRYRKSVASDLADWLSTCVHAPLRSTYLSMGESAVNERSDGQSDGHEDELSNEDFEI